MKKTSKLYPKPARKYQQDYAQQIELAHRHLAWASQNLRAIESLLNKSASIPCCVKEFEDIVKATESITQRFQEIRFAKV